MLTACWLAVRRHFAYKGWLVQLAPSPDSTWLAAGCNDNTVRLWRRSTGQELQCGGYSSKITSLSWNTSGQFLVGTSTRHAFRILFFPAVGLHAL